MSDVKLEGHALKCDWPGCNHESEDEETWAFPDRYEALRWWSYTPNEHYKEQWCTATEGFWLHDPQTGYDYCPKHWHEDPKWKPKPGIPVHRVPGPSVGEES